jgi:succinate-semialdehyde dehydrogenase / glutarate-semialdehyde dehydrogenase
MTYSGPTDLYIAGTWRPAASGACFTVTDPATGTAIAEVADADVTDARAATDAAEKALPDWARRPPRERAEVLRRVFEAMTAHRDELAELIVRENGKPLADARGEIAYAAEFFRWYSEEAVRAPRSLSLSPGGERRIMTSSRPVGVSLLITPWNLPAAMVTRKVAPALAAGCTVVVKPSFHTPLVALRLAELFAEAAVPAGVVNVVPTTHDIPVVGDLLERGPVRMLSFTGSTRVGSALLAQAAARVVNCSMELSGNAPFIVCRDADPEDAVRGALVAKFRHSAQVCIAANRFFVHEDRVQEFAEVVSCTTISSNLTVTSNPAIRLAYSRTFSRPSTRASGPVDSGWSTTASSANSSGSRSHSLLVIQATSCWKSSRGVYIYYL